MLDLLPDERAGSRQLRVAALGWRRVFAKLDRGADTRRWPRHLLDSVAAV